MRCHHRATLFCCAHPKEAQVLPPGLRSLVCGVGKTFAASALSDYLARDGEQVERIFVFGVAGSYLPLRGALDPCLAVGQLVWVQEDRLLDEGAPGGSAFLDLKALGLLGDAPARYLANQDWLSTLAAGRPWPLVAGATVSSCSSTQALSQERVARSQAQIESMEGAALAHVCARHGLPWVCLRAISNTTGPRAQASWDLDLALRSLKSGLSDVLES